MSNVSRADHVTGKADAGAADRSPVPIAPSAPIAPITPIAVRAFSTVSAAGIGEAALRAALADGRTRLTPNRLGEPVLPTFVGAVQALDEGDSSSAGLPSRALRLARLGLLADGFGDAARAAVRRHGAHRVGLALGTSAATIDATEAAYRSLTPEGAFPAALRARELNTPHAPAMFVAAALGLAGPVVTVSTACSSSAKVFAVAERWLRLRLVDAVVAGGVDPLCGSVLYGFSALGLVSATPCRPFDRRRNGISVGEAAGFMLLERNGPRTGERARESAVERAEGGDAAPPLALLLGHGEASDAHHMSSPHPQGLGAEPALAAALARAGFTGRDIDYVNLHGTASAKNDEVEAMLVRRGYGARTLVSATKGLTGHTMGAAGMLEAAVCLVALRHGLVPGSTGCEEPDEAFGFDAADGPRLVRQPGRAALKVAASHSFGFGGSNAVLVFGAVP